eukprot:SAG11_NODE_8609_length_995_cov_4.469866_2_plen_164_part_00
MTGTSECYAIGELMWNSQHKRYDRLKPKPKLVPSEIEIVLGNGDVQRSKGKFTTRVIRLQSIPLDVTFYIMELPSKSFTAILGETFMYRHKAILNIYNRTISFAVEELLRESKETTRKQVAGVATLLHQLPTAPRAKDREGEKIDEYDLLQQPRTVTTISADL